MVAMQRKRRKDLNKKIRCTFSVIPIGLIHIVVTSILHLAVAVTVFWASRSVSAVITAVVVTLTAVILTGRVATAARRGRTGAAARRGAFTAVTTIAAVTAVASISGVTGSVSARVEAPGSRRGCTSPLEGSARPCQKISRYLNLQEIITADALVVHVMVGFVRIMTAFIFHESEPII